MPSELLFFFFLKIDLATSQASSLVSSVGYFISKEMAEEACIRWNEEGQPAVGEAELEAEDRLYFLHKTALCSTVAVIWDKKGPFLKKTPTTCSTRYFLGYMPVHLD